MEDISQNIGFIMGNSQRQRILKILGSKGQLSLDRIAKIEHIPMPGVKRSLEELSSRKIVTEKDGIWRLTDLGEEIEKEMKKRA